MQDMSYEHFEAECEGLINRYLEKCSKHFQKKKNYNYIAHSLIKNWLKNFHPSIMTLEILKSFSAGIKDNKKKYEKLNHDEKYIIDLMTDSLTNVIILSNAILEIVYKVSSKL